MMEDAIDTPPRPPRRFFPSATSPSMKSTRSRKASMFERCPVTRLFEHADAVAAADQGFGDMRADEARAAGHEECAHRMPFRLERFFRICKSSPEYGAWQPGCRGRLGRVDCVPRPSRPCVSCATAGTAVAHARLSRPSNTPL